MADNFRDYWANFDPNATGFIKMFYLPDLLLALGKPIGWDDSFRIDKDK